MTDAYVLGGVRTAVGRYGGSLSHIRTDDLLGQTMVVQAMTSAHKTMQDLAEPARQLRGEIPEVIDAYATMQRAVMVDGALPAKVKELIALAISATRQCDGSIAAHARGVVRQQASAAEVAEAMGVVVMMNGDPERCGDPVLSRPTKSSAPSTERGTARCPT